MSTQAVFGVVVGEAALAARYEAMHARPAWPCEGQGSRAGAWLAALAADAGLEYAYGFCRGTPVHCVGLPGVPALEGDPRDIAAAAAELAGRDLARLVCFCSEALGVPGAAPTYFVLVRDD